MKKKNIIIGVCCLVTICIIIIAIMFLMKPKYEVTFVSDDKVLESLTIREDGTIVEPTAPTKEGYIFVGWYSNGERFNFSTTKVTEDLKLEARWTKDNAIIYTITFDSKGGEKVESINVEKNNVIGNLPKPTKKDYTFDGWYFGTELVNNNTVVTRDMTLVAKWTKADEDSVNEKDTTKKTTTKKTTTKKTTKKATTTTTTTTTQKVETQDVISYKIEKSSSVVGQITLFLTKNGTKVSGTCDIVYTTGETVENVKITSSGLVANEWHISTVKNIKVN